MKKKVLLIEDNPQNRYLFSFLLDKKGFSVFQAEDGFTGIEMAQKEKPDFILLDIQLPKMNGYEVAKKLKNTEATKNIPIIAVTSYAMKGEKETILDAGCNGYIEKPINPDSFIQEIIHFLKNQEESI